MTHRATAIVSISVALLAAAAIVAISQNSATFAGRVANLTARTTADKSNAVGLKPAPIASMPSLDLECSLIAAGSQGVTGCGDAFKNDGNDFCFGVNNLVEICSNNTVSVYRCPNGCDGGACTQGDPTDAECGNGVCEPGEYVCGFGIMPPVCDEMTGDEREACERLKSAMNATLQRCKKANPHPCDKDCEPPA